MNRYSEKLFLLVVYLVLACEQPQGFSYRLTALVGVLLKTVSCLQKSRPMEMIFTNGHEKKFELRDLRDGIEVTEIVSLELPPLGKRLPQGEGLVRQRAKAYSRQLSHNSGSSEDDEGIEESGEEKVHR